MLSPLREFRKKLGLTQAELHNISKASMGHISEAENGMCELGEALERFLEKLGESAAEVPSNHKKFMKERTKALLKHVDKALSEN